MRRITIQIVRYGVGALFILNGINNIFRYPISALLAIGLGFYMLPIVEKEIFKRLKVKPSQWVRLTVAGVLFSLFNLSLPRPTASDLALPSPLPSTETIATPSATPVVPIATASAAPSPEVLGVASPSAELYLVTKVVDGDTLKVDIDGKVETVRIVGVNTPETVDPRRPVQCFGKEASEKAKQILTGKRVSLENDVTQQNRDRYDRLLRFVFLEDGTDVGWQMIKDGYAQESLYSSKPHKYREKYLAAQAEAQQNKRGLWADDACLKEE